MRQTLCASMTERLGALADGDDPTGVDAEVTAHLASCARCRDLAADLVAIRSAATMLPALPAPASTWTRVQAAIGAAGVEHSVGSRAFVGPTLTPAWLAAAAVLLLAVGGALGSLAADWWRGPAEGASASAAQVAADLAVAETHYLKAIAGLERLARSGDGALDPQVAEVLRANLRAFDNAIGDTRAALQAQPDDVAAQRGLFDALEGKVALLEDTVALIGDAGADGDDDQAAPLPRDRTR